jgi:hypothetical protein
MDYQRAVPYLISEHTDDIIVAGNVRDVVIRAGVMKQG